MKDGVMSSPIVFNDNGQVVTTSLIIAEKFGKNHRDILKAIKNIECSQEFRERNFALSSYLTRQGKELAMYIVARDGCMFLIMGFTGSLAAAMISFMESIPCLPRARLWRIAACGLLLLSGSSGGLV